MKICDGWGIIGLAVDYALIAFFSFGALLLFLFCYKTGRLNFDEVSKYQMLEEDLDER